MGRVLFNRIIPEELRYKNDVMDKKETESNQFGIFKIDEDGGIALAMRFIKRPAPEPSVRLLWGTPPAR